MADKKDAAAVKEFANMQAAVPSGEEPGITFSQHAVAVAPDGSQLPVITEIDTNRDPKQVVVNVSQKAAASTTGPKDAASAPPAPSAPAAKPTPIPDLEKGAPAAPAAPAAAAAAAATAQRWRILFGVAAAAAVAFVVAFGVTSMRWGGPAAAAKPPPLACQFLGIRVGLLAPAIGAASTCAADGTCYNMTTDDMKAYIGTPPFVPLDPNYFSCIDGRHDDGIIATPAGDMGVFLTGAAIHIANGPAPADYAPGRVKALLKDFILKFRTPSNRFYYHTDTHAVEHVVEAMGDRGFTEVVNGVRLADLAQPTFVPPAAAKEELLKALTNMAVGVGCGHVKYMGLSYKDYGLPSADLVINTVRAVWELKWGELANYIHIEELEHDHGEKAVLTITKIEGCDGMSPVITQRSPEAEDSAFFTQQIFVNHEAAVYPFRRQVSDWLLSRPDAAKGLTKEAFYNAFDQLAGVQLTQSAVRLAKNRPLFNATVTGRIYTPPYNP